MSLSLHFLASVLLNDGAMAAMAEWCGGFSANSHRQFVNGGPPWQRYRLQWHVYVAEFWPSAVFRHPPLITLPCIWFAIIVVHVE